MFSNRIFRGGGYYGYSRFGLARGYYEYGEVGVGTLLATALII